MQIVARTSVGHKSSIKNFATIRARGLRGGDFHAVENVQIFARVLRVERSKEIFAKTVVLNFRESKKVGAYAPSIFGECARRERVIRRAWDGIFGGGRFDIATDKASATGFSSGNVNIVASRTIGSDRNSIFTRAKSSSRRRLDEIQTVLGNLNTVFAARKTNRVKRVRISRGEQI